MPTSLPARLLDFALPMSLEAYAKKRFLIVDELDSFRFATKKMLISLGLKLISTASSAQQVVSGFQDMNFDVILCNFDLADGKNGQELLEELRYKKLLKHTGLFFIVTAEVAKGKVLGTLENEPDGYLVKPLTPAELKKRLTSALEQKDATRQIDLAIDDRQYEKAIELCDEKLRAKAGYRLLTQRTKVWLLEKNRDLAGAKALYEKILAQSDYSWAEYGLAKILTRTRDFDKAGELLRHIIEKEPDRIEAYDALAAVYDKQNKPEQARDSLHEAAKRSPNSLNRQQALANICIKTGEPDGALEAFRRVVKLGQQSVYATTDHYFQFADYLVNSSLDAEGPTASKQQKEAFDLVQKAKKRFSNETEIELKTLYKEAQLHSTLGNDEQAQALFEQAEQKRKKLQEQAEAKKGLQPETAVIGAQAGIRLGHSELADQILNDTVDSIDNPEDDNNAVEAVYDLLDTRITMEQRQQAASYNKSAIAAYSSGDLDAAISAYEAALPLTPRHISLNLNYLQVLLKRLQKGPSPDSDYNNAQACVHRLRHVPPHHREYPRYRHLSQRFQKMEQNAGD
ncbi:MAG: tetratricopeptide repeat protein [Pseudomonadales bacterium]|nr:tetratricopeptide repeat protein [Pseudomonadales bacterium]